MRIVYLALLGLALTGCSNLSKSPETLRHNYLAITLHGTSMDEAVRLIKTKIKPEGSLYERAGVPCLEKEELSRQKGAHSIKVDLGWYYWGVVKTHMYGEWCFNDNENLIDIIVYRDIDESSNRY